MSRPLARGWATVDLERAASELGGLLGRASFEPADRSAVLGARCLRGSAVDGTGLIVLLEPDTEGRIAGFLARYGEGWAATWVDADERVPPAGSGGATPGPFGPERLEPGSPSSPFRLHVTPATIGR